MLEGATSIITKYRLIHRPLCKESRVRSPENTARISLAKTGSYSHQKKLQYIIDANK